MECKAGKEYDLCVVHIHPFTAKDKPWRNLLVPGTAIAHFKGIIQAFRHNRKLMARIDALSPSWAAAAGE